MKHLKTSLILSLFLCASVSTAQHGVRVATWNLEHLDGSSRGGFGACGNNFDRREPADLAAIADLIEELNLDIVAIQEVKVTVENDGSSSNEDLSAIESNLGNHWDSYIAKKHTKVGVYHTGAGREQVAFLYNTQAVRMDTVFELVYPALRMQDSDVHDRHPLVGRFTILKDGEAKNNFVLVNLHLASGQSLKENKATGMAMIYNDVIRLVTASSFWDESDGENGFEDDIVFLGDFNHNPYREQTSQGDGIHSLLTNDNNTADPGFVNLVKEDMSFTRFNTSFSSLIDHIYVSRGMQEHLQFPQARIHFPFDDNDCDEYAGWRERFSDHLPVYFKILAID